MSESHKTQVWRPSCPKCGSARLQHVEDVCRYSNVLGVTDDGVMVIDNSWPPDIDDEGSNERFECQDCGHAWHIDGRDTDGVTTTCDWAGLDEIEEVQ